MKRHLFLLIFLALQFQLWAQTPANDPHWELLWQDNFSGTDLNNNIWVVKDQFDHYYYQEENGELVTTDEGQVYTNRKGLNYDVKNGKLKLCLRNECYSCQTSYWLPDYCSMQYYYYNNASSSVPSYWYTGGNINSKQNFDMHYGYIEAKIAINYGEGFFPAFWLFGTESDSELHQGSYYQEIDIFEMTPHRTQQQNSSIIHDYNLMTSNWHIQPGNTSKKYSIIDYRNYHVYGLEWTPSKIIYYVDGAIYRIETNLGIFDPKTIILNFAVKRNYVTSSTIFPGEMEVDYVRVYKPRKDYSTTLLMNNYNFGTHDNRVKKKIIMNGTNALDVNDNIYLRATEGVEINGSFTVPVGAQLYIDVNTSYD